MNYLQGESRKVSVFKNRAQQHGKQLLDEPVALSFSPQASQVLQDYLRKFPVTKAEASEGARRQSGKQQRREATSNEDNDAMLNRMDINACNDESLQPVSPSVLSSLHSKLLRRLTQNESMQSICSARMNLPIWSFREQILQAVHTSRVVLIAGQTGCGKTTQVPQYILEAACQRGESCRIACTQPRRISAVSVAERIAQERGETIGTHIHYSDLGHVF